jgi:signal transduction histidine kinase
METLRRLRARQDPAFDEYFDEASRTVLDEVHRIATIVTEFTRYARLPPPRPEPVDVGELAEQVAQLHRPALGAVQLVVRHEAKGVVVKADRDQVVQVLTNLIQNARDALGEGGGLVTVSITEDAEGARITVADDGPGVPPDVLPRLFEPYATTKATGTGLGLAISQRIAVEHGGALRHRPSARGAAFELQLPFEGPVVASEPPLGTPLPGPPSEARIAAR